MGHNIRTAIKWFFRWGEHAKFATDLAEYFGLQKMTFSVLGGLLTAVAQANEASPFLFGAAGFAVTLVIINAVWGLINKWHFTKSAPIADTPLSINIPRPQRDIKGSATAGLNLAKQQLKILTGTGDDFETRRPAGLYMTNHTFSACVENGNPTQFCSNCK